MEQHNGNFREQVAIFHEKLDVFRTLLGKNSAIRSELNEMFAEVLTLRESLHLLRAAAEKQIVELRLGEPLMGAKGTQKQNAKKIAETT